MQNETPDIVVVTDASSILGLQITRVFLEAGFRVRGLVRVEEDVRRVWREFANEPFVNLELTVVPSLIDEVGLLSGVLKDVAGIIHTAIPVIDFSGPIVEETIESMANETRALLDTVLLHGANVSSVVLTASILDVIDTVHDLNQAAIYTEQEWNSVTWDDVSRSTTQATALLEKNREQAAWMWFKERHPIFKLSTVCIPIVTGPIPKSKAIADLPDPIAQIWAIINGQFKEIPPVSIRNFVDVRDAASAHLQAFRHLTGGRFIASGGRYCCSDICDILRIRFPEYFHRVPCPRPEDRAVDTYEVNNEWTKQELDVKFRTLGESIVDTVYSLISIDIRERHYVLWMQGEVGGP